MFTSIQTILKLPGFTDNVFTHLVAGLGAGFFAVCIGSPVDVVTYQKHLLNSLFVCDFAIAGILYWARRRVADGPKKFLCILGEAC